MVILFTCWLTSSYAAQDEVETIVGTVTAVDWDEDGNIIAIAISVTIESDEFEEECYQIDYYVADTKKGNELSKLIDKLVRVTGKVAEDAEGNKTIYVSDYKVIEEDEG
jgi:hypothetical protein